MYKKFSFIILLILIFTYLFINNSLIYVYNCPYTNTKSFYYIAKPLKRLCKNLLSIEKQLKKEGIQIQFNYQNAYGSGFLKNNPIPNDLDYIIQVDLGIFDYNHNNVNNIAHLLSEKISIIEPTLLLNMKSDKNFYPTKHFLNTNPQVYNSIYNSIKNDLDLAISGKSYIKNSKKTVSYQGRNVEINMPYIMNSNEILIENQEPVLFLAKNISYNKSSLNYLRELSIVIEYTFKIKKDDKIIEILIIPESALGTKLQLSRKLYVSNSFIGLDSLKFIKDYPAIQDNEEYFFYRMLSFRRHLQEAENIILTKDRPIKILKRIMQTADTIEPMLTKELYTEISHFIESSLNNPKIKILNEIDNLIHIFFIIQDNNYLHQNLINTPELSQLYNQLEESMEKLKKYDINKELFDNLNAYKNSYLYAIVKNQKLDTQKYLQDTENIKLKISKICNQNLDLNKLKEYINNFNKIIQDAGYHKVEAYWINHNTIGIILDDYTKTIDDLKDFAKVNNLPNVNYKFISPDSTKIIQLRHNFWVRYNSSITEDIKFKTLKTTLIKDKSKFSPKLKLVFFN